MDALLYMENNGLKDKNVAVRTLAVRRRIWPSVLPRVYTSEVAMMLHEVGVALRDIMRFDGQLITRRSQLHALFADGWLHNGPGVTNKLLDIIMPLRVKMMEYALGIMACVTYLPVFIRCFFT